MTRTFVVGEEVVYHGVVQAGGEWLADVVQKLPRDMYLIKFRDSTMKLVHSVDLAPWEGAFHEDDYALEVDFCE